MCNMYIEYIYIYVICVFLVEQFVNSDIQILIFGEKLTSGRASFPSKIRLYTSLENEEVFRF